MDAERYGRLEALFREVCDLPQAERTAAIAAACGDDATLAADLKALLAAAPGAEDFFDALAERCGPRPAPEGASILAAGTRIGAWRIGKPLGAGGMGVVYEAERADGQFAMRAALKIVSVGLASKESRDRFVRERDILAGLDHPGLAHMVDGGVTGEGLPYFVMEYVDGQPIDRYCDQHQLTVSERLALVRQVLEVVQYAHRNLVVHRDLKPSNILVTEEGRVKLLDFGIAKVLDPTRDTVDPTELTRAAGFPMTPAWASPEQCRGEAITTASDVYTLGVLLYLLLTGRSPYSVTNGSPAAWREAICEQPATTPSLRVRQPPDNEGLPNPEAIAVNRGATLERLSRRLKGDLDNILLVALRKEPERRYATVEQLAADLRRHAEGRPVEARPDTWQYRAGKFLRRHWIGAGATALVALAVLAGLGGTIWQARLAEAQATRAATEAGKAQQVKTLVLRLFEGADPREARGQELSAREVLDRGWSVIESELAGQPEIQIELRTAVGEIYYQLGHYDQAESMFRQAMDTVHEMDPPAPVLLATVLRANAKMHRTRGDFGAAEKLLEEALTLFRNQPGALREEVAATLDELGIIAQHRGDLQLAEDSYTESLEINRGLFGEEHPHVADGMVAVGLVLSARGEHPRAQELLSEAVEIKRRLLPDNHPSLATSLQDLAVVYRRSGELDNAERLYREALASFTSTYGEQHSITATTITNLGRLLYERGELEAAESEYRRALEIKRAVFGERHRDVAYALNDLAGVSVRRDDLEAAESYFLQAVEIYPADDPWRPVAQFNLGRVYEMREEYAAARQMYQAVVDGAPGGANQELAGTAATRLAEILRIEGNPRGAESHLRQALELFREKLPESRVQMSGVLFTLGRLLLEDGRPGEAAPFLREALEIRRAEFERTDPRILEVLEALDQASGSST